MTQPVLVVGESIMDVVRQDGIELRQPGGSPLNVAFGLGRLGVETALLTHIGVDADGDAIRHHLDGAGVLLLAGPTEEVSTSTAVATIGDDGSAEYTFDIQWALPGFRALKTPAWVHVGSISTLLTPGADSVERLLRSFPAGITISYDPNIRPAILVDHADAVARCERLCGLADVVKLSDEDAAWLYPTRSVDFVIDRILSLGPEFVVVTRGAEGARLATHSRTIGVSAPSVEVADTIGAGDSFMATLIGEVIARGPLNLALGELEVIGEKAALAAALTCSRKGAQPPTRAELDASPPAIKPMATNQLERGDVGAVVMQGRSERCQLVWEPTAENPHESG
jgi:fructokinase